MATNATTLSNQGPGKEFSLWTVIWASSSGTMIEWYDFYLYGSLAVFFSTLFFPRGNPTAAFLASLATFGAGFAVRPFGAVIFGRVGDLVGRKYAFLVTLTIMGLSTTLVGLLPTYEQVGLLAPALLVGLRLLQGLALGGEYGGAATYVAEHSPDHKRGYLTSFIQTTATIGFFLALAVIGLTRYWMGDAKFRAWGWRVPFLISAILVIISIYIRLKLKESPLYARLKDQGKSSKAPIRDSFGNGKNWKLILLALFGATAGEAVVWYTGQFYALFFLQTICHVPWLTSYLIVAIALLIGTPFFLVFGSLSDKIGRMKIMCWGCMLAAITYYPLYKGMVSFSNPVNIPMLILLVTIQVIYVTMVYGPIAAFLVELFPARIRYTSMSLPYHIGNGWFGGFSPLIATAIVAATATSANPWIKAHSIYMGLVYPIVVAVITFFIGMFMIGETKDTKIWAEVGMQAASGDD
ncbi:MAG TPA: MFS transporter [Candidatus Angelobacter sp.]|nr:MFS transporter [Candidatus Angelobacter sp.]